VLVLIATVLLLSASARAAQGRGTVVIVVVPESTGGWPEAERRASAELRALGFRVVRASATEPTATLTQAQLVAVVESTRALAAVRFDRVNKREPVQRSPVSIYLVDRSTRRLGIRQIGPERVDEQLSAEQAALLAAELVYASLVDVRGRSTASPAAPAAGGAEPTWGLRGGLSVAGSPGKTSPFAGPFLAANGQVARQLGLDLRLDLAAIPARVSDARGSARLYVIEERLHVLFLAPQVDPRPALGLGLGGGLLTVHSTGSATAPLEGTADTATLALVSAMGLAAWRLTPTLRAVVGVRTALTLPELQVRFAGEEVARFGRPLFDGSAGLEWRW
jgi:hypothetical protein